MLPGGAGLGQGHRRGERAGLGIPPRQTCPCPPTAPCSLSRRAHHNVVSPADDRRPESLLGLESLESLGAYFSSLIIWRAQERVGCWSPAMHAPSNPSLFLFAWDSLRSNDSEEHWAPSALQGHRNTPPVSSRLRPRVRGAPTTMATLHRKAA